MGTYLLLLVALAVSVPFCLLSARTFQNWLSAGESWLIGLVLGAALFTYTILLVRLIKRQPPVFLKHFLCKDLHAQHSSSEISGLKLDYIGTRDPGEMADGVVHNRSGELQRILRCFLPAGSGASGQSLLFETLFANLSCFKNTRFQIIFPPADCVRRKEMFVIASYQPAKCRKSVRDESFALEQMQGVLERLMERLITLGIAPRVMAAAEVRQLISSELGGCTNRFQGSRDWRSVGNLGWQPSFHETVLRPSERFMQVADRRSCTIALEELPSSGNFQWFATVLADIPYAHVSLFITPWTARNPISKMRIAHKLKKKAASLQIAKDVQNPSAAQMSFFFRFEGRDAVRLESEVATARQYFYALGLRNNSLPAQVQQQLLNWRSTLPCAQEQVKAKHLIAFMQSSGSRA